MLKLSKKSEYALLALHHLGGLDVGGKATVGEIAEAQSAPKELLAKIMQVLKRDGLLGSIKGVSGGYMLTRPLGTVSFLDAVRPFEEYVGLSKCSDPGPRICERADCCALTGPMVALNAHIMRQLRTLTVEDFLAMRAPSPPPVAARDRSRRSVATAKAC